jgi:hypothetical protein
MKLLSFASAAFLALAALASAQDTPEKRLVDISETELTVEEYKKSATLDTFIVTVQRTDDLLADDGTFLAERIMSLAFNFDVLNHEIKLNNVALPLDKDSEEPITVTVTVEASIVGSPVLDPSTTVEDLEDAFDIGLVTVQVNAYTEFVTLDDGTVIRRLTLEETVVEVNGQEVVQTDVGQQLIEIMPDGSVSNYQSGPLLNDGSSSGCFGGNGLLGAVEDWFNGISAPGLIFAGFVSFGMFFYSVFVMRQLYVKYRMARYAQLRQTEISEDYLQVAIIEEIKYEDEKKAVEQSV